MKTLAQRISVCKDCPLSRNRTHAVPGDGSSSARIMFIGEAPGFYEDQQGRPFVGPAGKFLDELLSSAGMSRGEVFITNMVKCRPPENRDPMPGEVEACRQYLDKQIQILKPRVIVALGRHSLAKFFPQESISKLRGKPRQWNDTIIYPMFHPAAALHNQGLRHYLEEDIKGLPLLLKEAPLGEKEQPQPQQLPMF
ncbi:MAG: uracil-DNA glycosylase [Chloroflexi bacterium]|nr:uracil-DNA glycosylase [Chloroflexota bacterium]